MADCVVVWTIVAAVRGDTGGVVSVRRFVWRLQYCAKDARPGKEAGGGRTGVAKVPTM